MDDLIQRQAVLDALHARFGVDFGWGKWWSSTHVLAAIESVPPVTPQETCDVPGTNAGDVISRAAVDRLKSDIMSWINSDNRGSADYFIVDKIEELVKSFDPPSVTPQPEEDCYTCIHRYFETWRCVNCRGRCQSNYERREEHHGSD